MIWREKRTLLIILAAILVANAVYFFTYRIQYENRLRSLDARRDEVNAQLQEAKRARSTAERQVAEYKKIQRDVDEVYEARWSTQAQRLTSIIAEVKGLAAASNLTPPTFSFSQTAPKSITAGEKAYAAATQMGISFTVQGSYQQVRRLINSIEMSDQFLIIEQIGLSADSGDKLSMNLQLKTLFRDAAAPPRRANQDL
jgi:Tfp pilus assembly protein PilO